MDRTRRSSGVSHQTAENGSTARPLRGAYGRHDNLFFLRKERHGALANTRSLAEKCRGNDIDHITIKAPEGSRVINIINSCKCSNFIWNPNGYIIKE